MGSCHCLWNLKWPMGWEGKSCNQVEVNVAVTVNGTWSIPDVNHELVKEIESELHVITHDGEMPACVKNACPRMVDHGCLKQSVRQSGPRVLLWKTLSQTPRHKIWRSSLSETICGVEIVWTSFETYASVYIAFHQFESLFLPWDMLNEKERLQASQRSGP